ncbi:MAG: DUF3299 domain-containing protein [Deltaproteobacteria bacterium]|jgi:hypothetical protein|nr:DUF3299 domain-containing protein [Deltaproteobacteria bacterium]
MKLLLLLALLLLPADRTAAAAEAGGRALGERLENPRNALADSGYKEIGWEELIPPSWNPAEAFAGMNLDEMEDDDPKVQRAFEQFRKIWNEAPVNREMDQVLIKLPGFVAPLDFEGEAGLKEFLLVPYFGACIHVPPPPANQIIHITLERPLAEVQAMDPVWVYGKILVRRSDTDMGGAGYAMVPDKVELYIFE